jgi:PBP1b-binding outer membrane lipoprotein LpoB
MKVSLVSAITTMLALIVVLNGCSKRTAAVDATQPLADSFQAAAPEVKQSIQSVNTSLNSGNYLAAAQAMEPVLHRPNLTDPQKQAIGMALSQMNQAIAANPALDSKEFYELRARMFQAMRGKSRF